MVRGCAVTRYIHVCNSDVFSIVNICPGYLKFCVVCINVMLSLTSVSFCCRCELGFLNCDDVCMCVVKKQFELLEFIFNSVYIHLNYNEIYLTFTSGSVCLCCICSHVSVLGLCEVVLVSYVVAAVNGMRVLLFVLDMSML